MKKISLFYLFLLILFSTGCGNSSLRYNNTYVNMSLKEFQAVYPNAERVDEENGKIKVFQGVPEDNIQKATYYFKEDKAIAIVIFFNPEVGFKSIASRLKEDNGKPDSHYNVMGSAMASWERRSCELMLLTGAVETKIQLPNGESEILKPHEIVLMMSKK